MDLETRLTAGLLSRKKPELILNTNHHACLRGSIRPLLCFDVATVRYLKEPIELPTIGCLLLKYASN